MTEDSWLFVVPGILRGADAMQKRTPRPHPRRRLLPNTALFMTATIRMRELKKNSLSPRLQFDPNSTLLLPNDNRLILQTALCLADRSRPMEPPMESAAKIFRSMARIQPSSQYPVSTRSSKSPGMIGHLWFNCGGAGYN
ncbi:uncharacterized protein BO80DRAFT_430072 [Aspergillus ibericus CBS 121593]|uniref:Uncharacterized protein n=1 Tax=Aspergillus ibericus CBS 121593 TaxID=1448316 RepID=A0A395GIC0_9EURO|nr:hypothetical protein BO80DRAFT_430072 [Aspergillus ibericus CBS 121593]RAK95180.1 hypothetical protein BO80DRAFT_430072 [Aspergillus ibericus CBS 121593]